MTRILEQLDSAVDDLYGQVTEVNEVLYGSKRKNEPFGMVKQVADMSEAVRELARIQNDMNAKLDKLARSFAPVHNQAMRRESNALSDLFKQVAISASVVTALSPILISDWRHQVAPSPFLWLAILLGFAIVFWVLAFATKKNGGD